MDKVVVKDFEPAIFKAMLLFVYTDKLPDVQETTCSPSMCMPTWCSIFWPLLCDELNADTVATTLALAGQHHCAQLKAICLKFPANPANLGGVMQSEGFNHLEKCCPFLLSELLMTFASSKESSSLLTSRKWSGSSVYGIDLATEGPVAGAVNHNGRRVWRR